MHPNKVVQMEIRRALPDLVERMQRKHPDLLLPTAHVVLVASSYLNVTRPAIYKNLTDAVADDRIVEVLMRRDRLVMLTTTDLPPLYAVRTGHLYELSRTRPDVRGSDGVSFLSTPGGYAEFLRLQIEVHRDRVPASRTSAI